MNAIETVYKGFRFRSRLEARWAVFFDALKIRWQYEPQGFEKVLNTEEGDEVIRYLPDFYLPTQKIWVEVKGCMDEKHADKLGRFLDFECPLPYFIGSAKNSYSGGLLILGDIPNDINGIHLHRFITHSKGLNAGWACFHPFFGVEKVTVSCEFSLSTVLFGLDNEDFYFDGYCPRSANLPIKAFTPKVISAVTPWNYPSLKDAYNAARQARFEHGQVGAPSQWRTPA